MTTPASATTPALDAPPDLAASAENTPSDTVPSVTVKTEPAVPSTVGPHTVPPRALPTRRARTDVAVTNIAITTIRPRVTNPKFKELLPTKLFAETISFELHGVSNAVSNAIRRVVGLELLCSTLYIEYADCAITDPEVLPNIVCSRIRMLPMAQSCPLDATFSIEAVNNTPYVRNVTSREIKIVNKGTAAKGRPPLTDIPFNETFTLFTLNPNKAAVIKNIRVRQSYGHLLSDGMHVMAVNPTSVVVDYTPRDMYAVPVGTDDSGHGAGPRTSMMDVRKWRVAFRTNGTMAAGSIVIAACDRIVVRVHAVLDLLHTIRRTGDEYTLVIPGENDTVGNLYMRAVLDLYPAIRAVTYTAPTIANECIIRIRTDDSVKDIYKAAAKYIDETFGAVRGHFT